MYYSFYNSPIGKIGVVQDDRGICQLCLPNTSVPKKAKEKKTTLIETTINQLAEYFSGKRRFFDIPLSLKGSDFQLMVWSELLQIPYGKTCCYKEIAEKIGRPNAQRAVGNANNKNPVPIIIPCHRVVGKNGNIVGYAGGVDTKAFLLQLEHGKYV